MPNTANTDQAQQALQQLADRYPTLSDQLRKAADFVMENPVDVALLSIRKAADVAGVTPTTLTRLAKELGYARYDLFRQLFQQQVQQQAVTSFGSRAQGLQERARTQPDAELFYGLASAAYRDLDQLYQPGMQDKLRRAAARLLKARGIYALGFRDAYSSAHHFAYMARIAFPHCELLRGMAGMLLTELSRIGQADVVVVFGSDPYTRETVAALEVVHSRGAQVIAVTDSLRSPLAASAAEVLLVRSESPQFFPSILSTIALVEALVAECVSQGDQSMLDNIDNFEKDLRRLGGYVR